MGQRPNRREEEEATLVGIPLYVWPRPRADPQNTRQIPTARVAEGSEYPPTKNEREDTAEVGGDVQFAATAADCDAEEEQMDNTLWNDLLMQSAS